MCVCACVYVSECMTENVNACVHASACLHAHTYSSACIMAMCLFLALTSLFQCDLS